MNASDIYSLGVTCLNLLTQVQPLELFDVTEWKWIWRNYLSSQESDNLAQVLDKMVEYAVKRRYQSAIEVLQALNPPNIAPTIINPPQPKNVQPPQIDNLSSDHNVDYTRLRDLLVAQKWKEADQETLAVMLQATGCDLVGRLSFESIENFPCTDLHTIDQLWVKYSNGRFGFSVQKQIWESVGRNYDKFGDHVGWRKGRWPNKDWIVYSEVTFDISAPAGHLPLARRQESTPLGGIGWWWANGFSSLVSRLV